MTAGRRLPWLQDVATQGVWTAWGATVDDIRIVDAHGRLVTVYSVAYHDLSVATNRAALKQLLFDAARIVDSDHDQLPDDWEMLSFGNLNAQANEDPDGDGRDNLAEFAAGTSPTLPDRPPSLVANLVPDPTYGQVLELQFVRSSAAWLTYTLEVSADLRQWNAVDPAVLQTLPLTILYDGLGTSRATARVVESLGAHPVRFVRWRASR